jgi:hypothetical protein
MMLIALLLQTFVSLPPFPSVGKDYSYEIRFPPRTTEVAIIWYYAIERRENIIYNSGEVKIRCCILRTDMYFPLQGAYIQRIMWTVDGKVYSWRNKYTARKDL